MVMTLNVDGEGTITTLPITFENKYGVYERDVLNMPIATMVAYLQAGAAHIHGNVVASTVTSGIRQKIAGKNGKTSEVSKEAVKAWRDAHPDDVKAIEAAVYASSLANADNGQFGRRESGPRLDPVEREFRNLVLIRATALCEGIGVKLPAARPTNEGEPAPSFRMADGNVFTRSQFLERVATSPKHGPELRKQAERAVTARARVAQQAKTDGVSATAESMF